ncbi:cAMP-dependent protein kinase type II regulatory chain [Trypanosoma grayi]|uniref:cAMP-dependent protein kinase type II regulatory chain n=1 Tax=Trypanosoma grayi TaxID=71804 RepID=UPI0004F4A8C0|nr:cAMP-dependent protein kinase type II regulatory chain [Trypanosoma grayi]KEG05626.1 cAMP-dependent protein kinase type II regulatory chain [Trypanosoma grayi]
MCPVTLKGADDDAFLHRCLSTGVYGAATSMQRGLAVAAFTAPRQLPHACVLYAEDPAVPGGAHQQCLYVVADGTVTVSHRGELVATYRRGQSVGEEVLLQKRRATPATTAIVTSPTCTVYQLDRKSFRCLLMEAYRQQMKSRRAMLLTQPLASRLSVAAFAAVCHDTVTNVFKPGEVILAQGGDVRRVDLLLEGTVDVGVQHDGAALQVVSSLGATDVIGALDLLQQQQRVSVACYIARSRLRTLSIPAALFADSCLRAPAVLEYLGELQGTARYEFHRQETQLLLRLMEEAEGGQRGRLVPSS